MRIQSILFFALLIPLATGCGANKSHAKNEAQKQWSAARSSVLYSLAKDQYDTGNFDKARSTVSDGLRVDPNNAQLHVLAAKLAIEQGQLEFADRELAVAAAIDPKNAEADYLLGVVCQRWQRNEAAYQHYTAAAEKNPSELAYLLARGEMLEILDRRDEALAVLQERVTFFEHSGVIRDAVGQLLVQKGSFPEAVSELRQAVILTSDEASIREHFAMALLFNGQHREACEQFAKLLKEPSYDSRTDIYIAMGQCELELGKFTDARGNFETAARLCPSSVEALLGVSKAAMQLQDYKRVELSVRKVLAIDPKSGEAYLLLGYLKLRQDQLAEALAAFQVAGALDPKDPTNACMIGYVYQKSGRREQAAKYYGQALHMQPGDELATKLMASIDVSE